MSENLFNSKNQENPEKAVNLNQTASRNYRNYCNYLIIYDVILFMKYYLKYFNTIIFSSGKVCLFFFSIIMVFSY